MYVWNTMSGMLRKPNCSQTTGELFQLCLEHDLTVVAAKAVMTAAAPKAVIAAA